MWATGPWAPLSFAFGAFVGLSEIISRYRDEPLRATMNRYGVVYLLLNGLVSVAAYGFLRQYPEKILPAVAGDPLMAAVVAGFGAMAILRSKLFIFRTEDGKEYPIGPSIVLETFLGLLDRKIDRLRASKRQQRVFEQMKGVTNFDAVANYLEASLLSFQNLTQDEKADIKEVIQQYRTQPDWSDALRIMAVGFAFLTIAGEENFDQVIANLKSYLAAVKTSPPPAPPVAPAPAPPPGPPSATPA